jgi:hypothetical protein
MDSKNQIPPKRERIWYFESFRVSNNFFRKNSTKEKQSNALTIGLKLRPSIL